jgi:hypothetical protein
MTYSSIYECLFIYLVSIYASFNDALNIPENIASYDRTIKNNELGMIWKEAVAAEFMVMSGRLPEGTDEDH